jgi:hypothetical protein
LKVVHWLSLGVELIDSFSSTNAQLLEKPEEFKRLLDGLTQLKSDSMHFTIMGASQADTFLELIVLQFLQKGTTDALALSLLSCEES